MLIDFSGVLLAVTLIYTYNLVYRKNIFSSNEYLYKWGERNVYIKVLFFH